MSGRLLFCFLLLGSILCCYCIIPISDISGCASQYKSYNTRPLIPKILSTNQSSEVVKGSTHVLECKVKNLGKFVVLWRKGDRILSAGKLLVRKDGKVKVTEKYDLKISDIEERDAGEYVCEVDVFGETTEVYHNLNVLGKFCLEEILIDQFKYTL